MPDSIAVKSMRMLEDKLDDGNRAKLSDMEFCEAVLRHALIHEAFNYHTDIPKLQAALRLILDMKGLAPA